MLTSAKTPDHIQQEPALISRPAGHFLAYGPFSPAPLHVELDEPQHRRRLGRIGSPAKLSGQRSVELPSVVLLPFLGRHAVYDSSLRQDGVERLLRHM